MTKEEIIQGLYRGDSRAIKEAIKALEQQTSAEERYQDLVKYFGDKNVAKCILEDREEFKKWLERIKWHVCKADELARKLEQQSDDCVSRAEVKKWLDINFCFGGAINKLNFFEKMDKEVPPVTPTHRMCKDCTKSKILNGFEGYSIVCSRFGRMAVNPDFYCADFEKRGNEDGSN